MHVGPDNLRPKLTPRLGPRPRPRRAVFQGHLMKAQEGHEDMAEDNLTLGTSQNTREKRQTRCRERAREKAANTVIRNSASDKPIPKTMPLCFFSNPQPL